MIKLPSISTIILISLSVLGCKKDANIAPLESTTSLPFYVNAEYNDTQNPEKRPFNVDIEYDENSTFKKVWSAVSAEGTTSNGHKYVVATMVWNPEYFLSDAPYIYDEGNDNPFNIFWGPIIGFKIVSDRSAEEVNRKFTKEEIESFLQEGKYEFGEAPFQVEVNFARLRDTNIYMSDLTPEWDHEFNDFEILDIEDTEVEYATERKVGKIVHVRAKAAVSRTHDWQFYLEMEGKFFVEYE